MIDAYHVIGIIPFCDMFNHASTKAHTSLLCDQHVCPTCGSVLPCKHDSIASSESTEMGSMRDTWLAKLSPAYRSRLESEGNGVEMRAERDIFQGEEVFSCYEEDVGDAKLLIEWGFVEGQGGTGGKGLSWNARDILHEDVVTGWVMLLQRGTIEDGIIGGDYDDDDVKGERIRHENQARFRLIGPADPEQFGLLNISPQLEVSINLVAAMYLCVAGLSGSDDIEGAETSIVNIIREIERCSSLAQREGGKSIAVGHHTANVVQSIVKLLDSRLEGYHRSDLALDACRRMQDVCMLSLFDAAKELMLARFVLFVVLLPPTPHR